MSRFFYNLTKFKERTRDRDELPRLRIALYVPKNCRDEDKNALITMHIITAFKDVLYAIHSGDTSSFSWIVGNGQKCPYSGSVVFDLKMNAPISDLEVTKRFKKAEKDITIVTKFVDASYISADREGVVHSIEKSMMATYKVENIPRSFTPWSVSPFVLVPLITKKKGILSRRNILIGNTSPIIGQNCMWISLPLELNPIRFLSVILKIPVSSVLKRGVITCLRVYEVASAATCLCSSGVFTKYRCIDVLTRKLKDTCDLCYRKERARKEIDNYGPISRHFLRNSKGCVSKRLPLEGSE